MTSPRAPRRIGLLLVGGIHHILHLVPVAAELERRPGWIVEVFTRTAEEAALCEKVLRGLGATRTRVRPLPVGWLGRTLSPKLAFVLGNIRRWRAFDALILAERTSTVLRRAGLGAGRGRPVLIHIPHGAGDRAKSYDPRIRHFDHVLVAGPKDKQRMVERGLVRDETCHVTGYIKPAAVRRIAPDRPRHFADDKPVVLYNPHFDPALSSWTAFGPELLEALSARTDINLIFAPHIRLFADTRDRAALQALGERPHVHVDLGSEASTDMRYTRAADIYVGDVSSQVYEFLDGPKPCIFLTRPDTQWRGNPDYAHWAYGPVCHSVEAVMARIDSAQADLPDYAAAQIAGCRAAKGDPDMDPLQCAAEVIAAILR